MEMIRCAECKHENNPDHHFCGMCGASLIGAGFEQADSEPSSGVPPHPAVTGPSFLGLSDPTASETDYSYLLSDEPRPSHWLVYSALILLFATGGVLAWRWQHQGSAWRALMASRRMLGTAPQPAAIAPPAATPAPAEEQKVVAEPDSKAPAQTNNGGQLPSSPDQAGGETVANLPSAEPSSAEPPPSVASAQLRKASSSEPIEPTPIDRQRTSASTQRDDDLAVEGEALLYGTSGPSDCARARTDLFIAAEHDNPRAQSILGTMFATGHCVPVDLPAAYQWLSRAQRRDPSNRRVASNLRIVWGEMSAEQQATAGNFSLSHGGSSSNR